MVVGCRAAIKVGWWRHHPLAVTGATRMLNPMMVLRRKLVLHEGRMVMRLRGVLLTVVETVRLQ